MISLPVFLAGLFYYRFGKKGKKDNKLFLSSFILIFLASVLEFVLILYINISWALSTQKDPLGIPLTVMILGTPILVIFVLGVLLGLIDFIIRKFRK
jgi:predicted membrane-bound mannosyltransferase